MQDLEEITVLWITAGLGCDGDTISITAATNPSIEDLVRGLVPGVPPLRFVNSVLSYEVGQDFLDIFRQAQRDEIKPFILVIEGSIPDESTLPEGCWAGFGEDPVTKQPIPTCDWIDSLAPKAWAVVAVGTCATYGGIHAMEGNPTGCMGLADYLGWDFRSSGDLPIVNIPGCPVHPDNFMETLLYLMRQLVETVPPIPLDDNLRPVWLFSDTVHQGCDRGGFYEQAEFAEKVGQKECIVQQGCWGPVVTCNVGKRGWINGVGGCPNVGGICIGCTMPGFPDKLMPFMNQPPGSLLSVQAVSTYGLSVKALRKFNQDSIDVQPMHHNRKEIRPPKEEDE